MNRFAGSVILSALLCFCAAGCAAEPEALAGKDDISEVKNTVDAYLEALEQGDLKRSSEYLSGSGEGDLLTEQFYSQTEPIKEIFSDVEMTDELQEQYDHFIDQIITLSFQSHETGEVIQVSDSEYQVHAEITSVDYDDISYAASSLLSTGRDQILTEEKRKELKQIYDEKGQTALDHAILKEMFDYMTDHFDEMAENCSSVKISTLFTVKKENDVWKITDAGSGQ